MQANQTHAPTEEQLKALVEADAVRAPYSNQGATSDPVTGTYRQRYSNQRYRRATEAPVQAQGDT